MQITLSTTPASESWGKNAILSFNQDQAVIHLKDDEKSNFVLVQKAARKLRGQGIKDVELVGDAWELENCWAFYQGFYSAKQDYLIELPQLFNVLKGEMSLVGPRPIVADELERYEENVDYYLMAKPGMTGLWQVSGRNDVDYNTRVYFDSWYVKNWSLWNDIAILFKTVNVVLKKDGAY